MFGKFLGIFWECLTQIHTSGIRGFVTLFSRLFVNPKVELPMLSEVGLGEVSEATIQAEFYHHARLIGLPCELEFHTPVGRLDIAVLSPCRSRLVAIVECKIRSMRETPQIRRYKKIGVPVYGLSDFIRAEKLALQIHRLHSDQDGVALDFISKMEPSKRRRSRRWRKDPESLRRLVWDEDLNIKI